MKIRLCHGFGKAGFAQRKIMDIAHGCMENHFFLLLYGLVGNPAAIGAVGHNAIGNLARNGQSSAVEPTIKAKVVHNNGHMGLRLFWNR